MLANRPCELSRLKKQTNKKQHIWEGGGQLAGETQWAKDQYYHTIHMILKLHYNKISTHGNFVKIRRRSGSFCCISAICSRALC